MRLMAVVGPTASGKTAMAAHLARRFDGELIGVDASQIYRGMSIGTGKATPEELGGIPHHLLDVVAPDHRFDAAQYVALADAAIAEVLARGRTPILVGGTGMYLRALLWGLCEAPPIDSAVRAMLRERLNAGETQVLHQQLSNVDPIAAARIHPNDAQRIERALGVYLSTERPLTEWQNAHGFETARYDSIMIGLEWPREQLDARIKARIEGMLEAGWLDEIKGLLESGYHARLPSMKALGYGTLAGVVEGQLALDEAVERTFRLTRKYAKRQMTWFKAMPSIQWFPGHVDPDRILAYVIERQAEEAR